MKIKSALVSSALLLTSMVSFGANSSAPSYEIGVAIADITGPSGEVQFGGFVDFEQQGQGIYMRQFARSFIIKANDGDSSSKERFVLVETDLPMQSAGVYAAVLKKLKAKYGDLYTQANVNIAATHTHAAPGGYFKVYMLNALAGLTYYDDYFNKIVDGIVGSIDTAHNSLSPGRVYLNSAEFSYKKNTTGVYSPNYRVSQNRSPKAYYLNKDAGDYLLPAGEVNPDNGSNFDDTNRQMVQLKFVKNDKAIGLYNWTPVHPHVSGPKNKLVNGDSFGLASYLMEKPSGTSYAKDDLFVAAFAMADSGDLTANLTDDALLFDDVANNPALFQADGGHDYKRMEFRAKTIVALTQTLASGHGVELTGKIESRQMFVPARNFAIKSDYINQNQLYYQQELGETLSNRKTCDGAVGLGQLAGSVQDAHGLLEEGQARDILDYSPATLGGLFNDPLVTVLKALAQATTDSNELMDEMNCELEKSIAISLASANKLIANGKPYNTVFPINILKIDNFAVLSLPVEVGTMPGRRLKAEVMKALPQVNLVAINANSNAYDSYIVTREEYASQQYEGGSNIFGPYTLNAIRQWTNELAQSFNSGTDKPDYAVSLAAFENQLETTSLVPSVVGHVLFDDKPLTKPFGSVVTEPASSYNQGQVASAEFWGAHPNNNLTVKSNESYLVIEKKGASEQVCYEKPVLWWTVTVCNEVATWAPVAYDYDTSTRYIWQRDGVSFSKVKIEWHIPADAASGDYRIRHIGQWKSGWTGAISRYEGTSNTFAVSN